MIQNLSKSLKNLNKCLIMASWGIIGINRALFKWKQQNMLNISCFPMQIRIFNATRLCLEAFKYWQFHFSVRHTSLVGDLCSVLTDGNVEAAEEVSDEAMEVADEADSTINTKDMIESDENSKQLVQ